MDTKNITVNDIEFKFLRLDREIDQYVFEADDIRFYINKNLSRDSAATELMQQYVVGVQNKAVDEFKADLYDAKLFRSGEEIDIGKLYVENLSDSGYEVNVISPELSTTQHDCICLYQKGEFVASKDIKNILQERGKNIIIEETIKNEPYTIHEALKAIDIPLSVLLRITAQREDKLQAALEIVVYANIIQKWALEHALSLNF